MDTSPAIPGPAPKVELQVIEYDGLLDKDGFHDDCLASINFGNFEAFLWPWPAESGTVTVNFSDIFTLDGMSYDVCIVADTQLYLDNIIGRSLLGTKHDAIYRRAIKYGGMLEEIVDWLRGLESLYIPVGVFDVNGTGFVRRQIEWIEQVLERVEKMKLWTKATK